MWWHQSILIPVCLRERERETEWEQTLLANIHRSYPLSLSDVAAAEEFLHSFSLVLDSNSSTFMFRSFVLWFSIRKFGHLSFSFCVYTFLWVLFQPGQRLVFFLKRGTKGHHHHRQLFFSLDSSSSVYFFYFIPFFLLRCWCVSLLSD